MMNPPSEYLIPPLAYVLGVASGLYAKRLLRARQSRLFGKESRITSALDSSINAKLAHVRTVLDADKAKIYQFQSTTIYFNYRASKKMSLTHLQLKEGIEVPNVGALQNLPTSLFPGMMDQLLSNRGIIYWLANKAPDSFLRGKHASENIKAVMMVGVYCKDRGHLLGFIALNWVGRLPRLSVDESKLVKLGKDLGSILGH